jgi:hypothetical protein
MDEAVLSTMEARMESMVDKLVGSEADVESKHLGYDPSSPWPVDILEHPRPSWPVDQFYRDGAQYHTYPFEAQRDIQHNSSPRAVESSFTIGNETSYGIMSSATAPDFIYNLHLKDTTLQRVPPTPCHSRYDNPQYIESALYGNTPLSKQPGMPVSANTTSASVNAHNGRGELDTHETVGYERMAANAWDLPMAGAFPSPGMRCRGRQANWG